MKVAIHTLGCKVNQYDSEKLISRIGPAVQLVDFKDRADVYVVNTCGVTGEAAHKSRQMIYRAKRANPSGKVVVVGCYARLRGSELLSLGADAVLEEADLEKLANQLAAELGLVPGERADQGNSPRRARRYLKIQDGCDQFCSYCVVPYARPQLASKSLDEVAREAARLESDGAGEIVLTGIHLGHYGRPEGEARLAAALQAVLSATNRSRVRLSSIEVTEISDDLARLMAANPRVARHLHIPLQSGSDRILSLMNRPYTRAIFARALERLRQLLPGLSVTTDLIVGFPGETDEDFNRSLDFLRQEAFTKTHVFSYSDRPPAPAAALTEKVRAEVKKARSLKALAVGRELRRLYARGRVGKSVGVVVERTEDDFAFGTSDDYLPVRFHSQGAALGDYFFVEVTDADGELLLGKRTGKNAYPRWQARKLLVN